MLPAKNYNIVNFILSNLDCYFPWQFFVNRTRGKDFQGGEKKEKLIKIHISRTTTSWNPWPWTFQRVHRPQQFVIIREEFDQACASKSITFHDSKLSFFSIDSTKIRISSKNKPYRSTQRFLPDFLFKYYDERNDYFLKNLVIALDGPNRKSRYSPSCFDREAVKKNTEPRSSWNQNKIYVAIHEHWSRVDVSGAKRKYRYS